jgi:hypothetical protein
MEAVLLQAAEAVELVHVYFMAEVLEAEARTAVLPVVMEELEELKLGLAGVQMEEVRQLQQTLSLYRHFQALLQVGVTVEIRRAVAVREQQEEKEAVL